MTYFLLYIAAIIVSAYAGFIRVSVGLTSLPFLGVFVIGLGFDSLDTILAALRNNVVGFTVVAAIVIGFSGLMGIFVWGIMAFAAEPLSLLKEIFWRDEQ